MKQLCLVCLILCVGFASAALVVPALAQKADGTKKDEPNKNQPKKDDPKKDDPAKGDASKDGDKKEDAKAAEEKTYDVPDSYAALMKRMRTQDRKIKASIAKKDSDSVVGAADIMRFYATKQASLDKSTDKRQEKEDYLKWAKELEDKARELRKLGEAKKVDWDKIATAHEALKQVCTDCHKVYAPDEE